MWCMRVTFVVFTTLHFSTPFNYLTPSNKEVIYRWNALIKAGTDLPQPHASQFTLKGKIHLQSDNNSISVKITDLTYQLYNGVLDHVQENQAHDVPLPPEVQDLENVFKLTYTSDGLVDKIVTESDEKEFSRNIKRALGTIFQLNKSVVTKEYKHVETFVVNEKSIYGESNMDYNVIPRGTVTEVHKMLDKINPDYLYKYFTTNGANTPCDANFEHILNQDSFKNYTIVKENGHSSVTEITAVGSIVYYPYKAKSDSQFIEANQKFELLEIVPVGERFHLKSEHVEDDLSYHLFNKKDGDVTNGRQVINFDKLLGQVQNMLKEVLLYLKEDHINNKVPDTKRGLLIDRIQRSLMLFSIEKLEELRITLKEDTLNVFCHILPLVGTTSATVYVKNLVISKTVSEETAIEMMQHLHQNFQYNVDMGELEELIHLNDSFSWNIRKAAILSFASLVFKSYSYDNIEKTYIKYADEYMNKIRTSDEYRVKMLYIFGLYNMKLPILVKYLVPLFRDGLEKNNHLRMLYMWSAINPILSSGDSNVVIESLWPIFTNPDEPTYMRVMSYFYIIHSQISHSRLRNILHYLLTERNEEVYHYAYTHLQQVAQSPNPCYQDLRIKLAQVLKFLPPTSHGISAVKFYYYKDEEFGFGGGLEHYFISSNTSQMYGAIFNSDQFHKNNDDNLLYLKVENGGRLTLGNTIFEALLNMALGPTLPRFNNSFVEAAVIKRGQVVSLYYATENNADKITKFFDWSKASETKNYLNINYYSYHRALIPTDLGIPAFWEYLMPIVSQNEITRATKTPTIQIDARYINWIHYRHGLKFYNPVSDVQQGINRFHSYDAVLPIHFDVEVRRATKLSWRKHSDALLNIAGIRSHVQQAVFVEDIYNRNVLVQSSPHAKEFQVVSYGKQFRHDYNIIDTDDLNTGHKYYLGFYDSNVDVSKGAFKDFISVLTRTNSKQFTSPFEHLLLSLRNWHHYLLLYPYPGHYGFLFRAEPSHIYNVTNIEVIFDAESHSNFSGFRYLPETKVKTSFSYSVKNQDQTLKAVRAKTHFETNKGHSVNNFLIELTQEPDNYTVFIERVKKWSPSSVESEAKIAFNDNSFIDVTMKGERLPEQQDGRHKYGSCQYVVPYSKPHFNTLDCLMARTVFRHYTYSVKAQNVPVTLTKTLKNFWDYLKGHFYSYYTYEEQKNPNISNNELQINLSYPIQQHELKVEIATSNHVHDFSGIPRDYFVWFGLAPDSSTVSATFYLQHTKNLVDHCFIYPSYYIFKRKLVTEAVPDTWTFYYGSNRYGGSYIYVKRGSNETLAVKAVDLNRTMEITPQGENYKVIIDGETVPLEEKYFGDWIDYYAFIDQPGQQGIFILKRSGIHLEYDVHRLIAVAGKEVAFSDGVCFNKN